MIHGRQENRDETGGKVKKFAAKEGGKCDMLRDYFGT